MEAKEWVDGAGWISDDSDFYGSEKLRRKLETRSKKTLKRKSETPFVDVVAKRVKLEPEIKLEPQATPLPTPTPTPEARLYATEDVLSFLKSRPQLASMQQDHVKALQPVKHEPPRTVSGKEADDLVHIERTGNKASSWQQDETVEAFLRRLPVATTTIYESDWLWVRSPTMKRHQRDQMQQTNEAAFMEAANEVLEAYEVQLAKVEEANAGKAQATITRKMRPFREQLECDLLSLAVKTHTTCGKWMLFPPPDDLPRTWRLIAEATAAGKLGPTSKVATYDPNDPRTERVICVYTYDFSDTEDVRRVLDELVELGLTSRDSARGIFYKCDAYTHLNIMSDNSYKIRASIYSGKELLNNAAKALSEGPIVRLKSRNSKIDSFFS